METVFTGDFKISPENVQTQIIFTQCSKQQINCENRASQTGFRLWSSTRLYHGSSTFYSDSNHILV